jgi:hypothetical protein
VSASIADALEPSGAAVAVLQSAAASSGGVSRVLMTQAPIFMGDRIKTGDMGEAQIRFRDDTRLVVGENSSILIDTFVFNADRTVTEVGMQAVRGSFRFISGVGRKHSYSIDTPTATIGIRGTRFDLSIAPDGGTNMALFEGAARVCDRAGNCVDVTARCSVVVVPAGGAVRRLPPGPREAQLRELFPYVVSQRGLRADFRVNVGGCFEKDDVREAVDPRSAPERRAEAEIDAPEVAAPEPAAAGNPGNDKPVGNAGENPGNGNFGSGEHGKKD